MMPFLARDGHFISKEFKALVSSMQESIREMESMLCDFSIPELPLLETGIKQLINAGGKRLRPCLAWVSYGFGREKKLPILPLMCMIEWMHTASLIHDDVVDDAPFRRGVPTLQTQMGKAQALAGGDYLLGIAMEYLHLYRGTGINEALADVSTQMCSGEFTQMKNLYRADLQNEEVYESQIRKKTAYLIATSCFCGGRAGGLSDEETNALRAYGERIGIAFQLKDDILDFTADDSFGKKRGQDLQSGIFTLPILHAFEVNPDETMISLAEKRQKEKEDVETLIGYVKDADGIRYTQERVKAVSLEAISCLKPLPDGIHKQALEKIAQVLLERKI